MAEKKSSRSASTNELMKNMEYLIKLLHKEWGRSGRTTAEAAIKTSDLPMVLKRTAAAIMENQERFEKVEMTFKQSMELSGENFVLLRLARKIDKADKRAARNGADTEVCIELDREEHRLLVKIMGIQEG